MHRCVISTSLLDQDVHNRSMCHLLIFTVFNLFGSLGRKDFWVLSETTSVDTLSNFKTIRQSPQLSPFQHCLWCSQHRLSQRTSISSRQKTSRRNIQPTNSHWAILELHPNSKDKSLQTILATCRDCHHNCWGFLQPWSCWLVETSKSGLWTLTLMHHNP